MKKYVCTFQCTDTMIHQVHEGQYDTLREFLACFMKAEVIAPLGPKALKKMNLESDDGQYLKQTEMYIGAEARKIVKGSDKGTKLVKTFVAQASAGYVECARQMLKSLPIDNGLLKAVACIDPALQAHSHGVKLFKELATYFKHLLTIEEQDEVHSELNRYPMERLPSATETDVMKWWACIEKSKKYPVLTKIAFATLSIFHGPVVESTFNVMGDIIHSKSTSTQIETYSAYQTVKYALKSRQTTALKLFERKDPRYSPVDRHMCVQMRLAAQRYKKKKFVRIEMKKDKMKALNVVSSGKLISKQKTKDKMKNDNNEKFQEHVVKQQEKAKKRLMKDKLVALAKKRKLTN